MARINLLPWREERRKQRNRDTQTMFVFVGLAAAVVIALIWLQFGMLIRGQASRNSFLDQEIKAVDEKIKTIKDIDDRRSKLLARKEAIEDLQANRSSMVHLFDSIVRTLPEGLRLKNIKQSGEQLTVEGFAESNSRISEYMRNLEASQWLNKPELQIIEAKGPDKRSRYAFILQVTFGKPAKVDEAAAASAETAGGTTTESTGTSAGATTP